MPSLDPPVQVRAHDLPVLRAAYSDRTAALMSTLAALAYDYPPNSKSHDSGARGLAAVIPPVFAELGFDRITYFHNGFIDGWAYVAEGNDIIAVAFRGTKSKTNWKTNFHVRMVHPENTASKLGVHQGFYDAFEKLFDGHRGIKEKIASLSPANVPIYITGHSLGGALAQITTAVIGGDQIAACYTFGSPRTGNKYFDLWVKPPSYRIVNDADIVPQIPWFAPQWPPQIYRHSGDARFLPAQADGTVYRYEPNLLTRAWQILKGLVQFLQTWSILGIEDHAIALYQRKLAAVAASRVQAR